MFHRQNQVWDESVFPCRFIELEESFSPKHKFFLISIAYFRHQKTWIITDIFCYIKMSHNSIIYSQKSSAKKSSNVFYTIPGGANPARQSQFS